MKLKTKIQILIFAVILLTSVSILSFFIVQFETKIIKTRKDTCNILINNIKPDIIYAVVINNKILLKNILKNYLKLNFICRMVIYKNNTPFYDVVKDYSTKRKALYKVERKFENINKFNTKNLSVVIYYSIEDYYGRIKGFIVNLCFFLFFVFVTVYFIADYYTSKFLSPVDYLLSKIIETKKGTFAKVNIEPGQDFEKIYKAYNKLIGILETRDREVKEKILELQKSNASLKEKILEIQMLQHAVIKQEKLATLGTITAGIAHEINNPVGAIRGLSELAIMLKDKTKYEEYFQKIVKHCDRIKDIVQSIKDYNREISNTEIEEVLFADLIREVVELCRNAKILPPSVVITGNFEKTNYAIKCVKNQMFQVFQNLISNSVDAMDGEGTIEINITEENNLFTVVFSDTGKGIDKNVQNKIFDPFFTTKGTKGTGLGLYIIYNIIKQHKGHIELIPSEKGAVFKIILPDLSS